MFFPLELLLLRSSGGIVHKPRSECGNQNKKLLKFISLELSQCLRIQKSVIPL